MSLTRENTAWNGQELTSQHVINDQLEKDNSMVTPNGSFQESSTIYTATYSGVKVIEMTVKGVAAMRRRSDSSFNATQILKIAGLDKAKRTKILEKEVHTGTHEKVQGGYGKFQGTWIPYDRAVALSQQYDVYEDLKPLFLYNASSSEANDTPTKEQAIAAQRKKSNLESFSNLPKGGNSFYKSMSKQPSNLGRSYSTLTENDETELIENNGSPLKKIRLNPNNQETDHDLEKFDIEIFEHDLNIDNPNAPFTLEPLNGYLPEHEHSKEIITQIFLSQDIETLADAVGGESALVDVDLDVSIDELGHTALHWASSLARVSLVKELVRRGSIRIRGNNNGESPLVRSVLVTNNYDQNSFDELLNLLYPCIPLLDHQRRSILHHIVLTAGIKKRSSASRYYLETLLEWIVKKGSIISKGLITLGKFMNEIVNTQDKNGDTPLNIAARIGNKAIVQQLLDVGADPSIPNRAGLRPVDFGINVNGLAATNSASSRKPEDFSDQQQQQQLPKTLSLNSSKILESMHQVLTRLDSDFQSEISAKQKKIDELHVNLRKSTQELSKNRTTLENLKNLEIRLNELKQKKIHIEKSIQEEEQKFINQTTELGSIGNYDVDFDADEPFRILHIYEFFVNQLSQKHSKEEQENSSLFSLITEEDIQSLTIEYNNQQVNLSELPPSVILKARIQAYKENEENLKSFLQELKKNSLLLESKFRRVVSLCTGVEETKIDDILDGLVQAVESDPDEVDMGRVVGFLRRVDDKVDA